MWPGGGGAQAGSEQTERLHEAFRGIQGAGPLAGLQGGQRPLYLRKICILRAKYA